MMYLRPHSWVDIPSTTTEIRQSFNVREMRHTCISWDIKYQDIDTGKFDTDRLKTVNSDSLVHAIEDSNDYKHGKFDHVNAYEDKFNLSKAIMLQERKELALQKELSRKSMMEEKVKEDRRIAEEERKRIRLKKEEEKAKRKKQLVSLEKEKSRQENNIVNSRMIYLGGSAHGQSVGYIKPNNIGSWGK